MAHFEEIYFSTLDHESSLNQDHLLGLMNLGSVSICLKLQNLHRLTFKFKITTKNIDIY